MAIEILIIAVKQLLQSTWVVHFSKTLNEQNEYLLWRVYTDAYYSISQGISKWTHIPISKHPLVPMSFYAYVVFIHMVCDVYFKNSIFAHCRRRMQHVDKFGVFVTRFDYQQIVTKRTCCINTITVPSVQHYH